MSCFFSLHATPILQFHTVLHSIPSAPLIVCVRAYVVTSGPRSVCMGPHVRHGGVSSGETNPMGSPLTMKHHGEAARSENGMTSLSPSCPSLSLHKDATPCLLSFVRFVPLWAVSCGRRPKRLFAAHCVGSTALFSIACLPLLNAHRLFRQPNSTMAT